MSTLNYIDENGNINKVGCIPNGYPATNIGYNNSQSGLSADNVQEAIDEVNISFSHYTINSPALSSYNGALGGYQEAVTIPSADVPSNCVAIIPVGCLSSSDGGRAGTISAIQNGAVCQQWRVNGATAGIYTCKFIFVKKG